jgi:3-deoxy-D-manno-octulosonic-acid transferase
MTAYLHLPKTFLHRVLLGRDPYWRQFFWSRWGVLPEEVVAGCRAQKVVWIDALSGGEVMQSFSFCKHLRRLLPDHVLVLSCNSYDAIKAARNISGIDHLIDTPWDIAWVARRVLTQIRPAAVVCVQTPGHPIFLREARKLKIPTAIVSAFMSADWPEHPTMARPMALNVFESVEYVGAKTDDDLVLFEKLGIPFKRLEATGDLKYDFEHVRLSTQDRDKLLRELGFAQNDPVLLGGSLNYGEEQILIDAFLKAKVSLPGLRLILAPRYLDRVAHIEQELHKRGCRYFRRSAGVSTSGQPPDVVLIDTFGELGRLYGIATMGVLGVTLIPRFKIAYGQNIIEPLIHGTPVFFGPYARRWEKITDELEAVWPGLRVRDSDDIARGVVELMAKPGLLRALREKATALADRQHGAVSGNARFVADIVRRQDSCRGVA